MAALPLNTLVVNVLGCFIIGLVSGLPFVQGRLFLMTGFCGGFTTMSAFVLETDRLFKSGAMLNTFAYGGATLLGSFSAFWAGLALARLLVR